MGRILSGENEKRRGIRRPVFGLTFLRLDFAFANDSSRRRARHSRYTISSNIRIRKARNMNLYTFGYEGLGVGEFIDRLRTAGVGTVVDVRELPLSRKKGFSKQSFAEALRAAGIEYV